LTGQVRKSRNHTNCFLFSRKNDIRLASKQDNEKAALAGRALTEIQKNRMAEPTYFPVTRVALALVIAVSIASAAAPASAQTPSPPQPVPVPKPAPKLRDGQTSTSDGQRGSMTAGATQVPNPFIPETHRNLPLSLFATFDDKQKAQAARISNYLSSLQTVIGNFIQVGPDGTKTKGQFYIQKPGKVRFEYDAPNPIAIVADGSMVAVRDRNLATQDLYPLSQTPLRYLLSDRIDLMKDTNVVSVTADDVYISITIEERQLLTGTSRLMLMVGAKDGQLKQWTVTDPQGYDTTVAVYNLDTSRKIDPGMFKIDLTERTFPPG
jgi:outer membrane lipoprotein-sorting protein